MARHPRLWHILTLAMILFGVTYIGVTRGWFRGLYFIDMPLHILGGIIIGLFWWWLVSKFKVDIGKAWGNITSFVGFSTLVSLAWESYEFLNWKYFAEVTPAHLLFSPTVSDLLSDILFTLLGSALVAFLYIIYRNKQNKLNPVSS